LREGTGKRGAQPRRGAACVALVSLAALLGAASTAAAAEITDRPLLFSFDGHYLFDRYGQPEKEIATTAGALREEGNLEAEKATGDVYVADSGLGPKVLDKFSAKGEAAVFAASGKSSLVISADERGAEFFDVALDKVASPPLYVTSPFQGGPLLAFDNEGHQLGWQLTSPEDFKIACAAAVDSSGHLWVVDRRGDGSPKRVREFDGAGKPVPPGFEYVNGGGFPCSIDFDEAGNAYVASDTGVFEYAKGEAGAYEYKAPPVDPQGSEGVAVERGSGHILVSHRESLSEYAPCAEGEAGCTAGRRLVGSFGRGVISSGRGIAVSEHEGGGGGVAAGTAYVANFPGHRVYALGPPASGTVPDVEAKAATEVGVSRAKLCGTINPNGVPNAYLFEWKRGTTPEAWGEAKPSPPQSVASDSEAHEVCFEVTELAGDTTYQARLVGLNEESGAAKGLREVSEPIEFTTKEAEGPPLVTIDPPSEVGPRSAKITGSVNPREDFGTTWWVETSEEGCGAGFLKGAVHKLESEASGPVAVEETLSGLLPAQHYCVRLRAENSAGEGESKTEELSTEAIAPDQVVTAFAAPRTTTTARLNAYANPEGEAMSYRFEYREAGAAAWIAPAPHEEGSRARVPLLFAEELAGLEPGTAYDYRFRAENAKGASEGGERTFTTRSLAEAEEVDPPSCPNEDVRANRGYAYLAQCRGIELVNKPADGEQNVRAGGGVFKGAPLSAGGGRAIWSVLGGAPGANSGSGGTFLAKRSAAGWESCSLIPPAAQQIHGEDGSYLLEEATPSLKSFLFVPGFSGSYTETLVRVGECAGQDVLRSYEGSQVTGNSAMSEDGARVLHIDSDEGGAHPGADQLEDIGTPGRAEVVSYLPGGSEPECGVAGEGGGFAGGGPAGAGVQWRAGYERMGADAARVYFQVHPDGTNCASTGSPWQILERDRGANGGEGKTLEVAPPGFYNALIRARPDGRSAYFVSSYRLDKEGRDTNDGFDVYRWEEAPDGLSGTDTCLTCAMEDEAGEPIAGGELRTEGALARPVLVSDDFSHVYFESKAGLTPQASAGQYNLYALAEGKLRFVATPDTEPFGSLTRGIGYGNGALSGDGNVLVFETTASGNHELTADRLAASCSQPEGGTGPCRELFRYDDRERSLECLSCLHGATTTASVGSIQATAGTSADFALAGDGETVAFVTRQALARGDVNGGLDLYEWRAGERRLITDGVGDFGQGGTATLTPFALSAEGKDVLFRITDRGLSGFEQNGLANLYDARIDGGFEAPSPAARCAEESCQGPLRPEPPFEAPGSANMESAGNPEAPKPRCPKGQVRRHGRCAKAHHRHHRHHHRHRAGRAR
jgi:hypothetical protein